MNFESIEEGMYVQLYSNENIYLVFSDYGVLSITFNNEIRPLNEFRSLINKIFTGEEIENCGSLLNGK